MSAAQKRDVVENTLDMLGLQEIRYSQIGDEGNRERMLWTHFPCRRSRNKWWTKKTSQPWN